MKKFLKLKIISILNFFIFFFLISCNPNFKKNDFEYEIKFAKYSQFNLRLKGENTITSPLPPKKKGFKFIGWYYNGKLFDFNTKVYSNMIFQPRFINISILESEIEKVKNIINDKSFKKTYTEKTKNALKLSLESALVSLTDDSQDNEIIDKINDLKLRKIQLFEVYKQEEKDNKIKIKYAIDKVIEKKKEKDFDTNYTFSSKKVLEEKLKKAIILYNSKNPQTSQVNEVFDKLLQSIENLQELTSEYYYDQDIKYTLQERSIENDEKLNLVFKNLDTTGFSSVKGSDIKEQLSNFIYLNGQKIQPNEFGLSLEKGHLKIFMKNAKIGDILRIKKGIVYKAMKNNKFFILGSSENDLLFEYNGIKFTKYYKKQ